MNLPASLLALAPAGTRRAALLRLVAYTIASVGALAVDMGCFYALLSTGLAAPAAAAGGYVAGIAAHWIASSRAVFADRLAEQGRARTAQQGLFVASALIGLAITWIIVATATAAGAIPTVAKLLAVAAAFTATFILRARYVFREGKPVRA